MGRCSLAWFQQQDLNVAPFQRLFVLILQTRFQRKNMRTSSENLCAQKHRKSFNRHSGPQKICARLQILEDCA